MPAGENSVIAHLVLPTRWHQGSESPQKVDGLKEDLGAAIEIRLAQLEADASIGALGQSLLREGRTQAVTKELFEFLARAFLNLDTGVK